MSESLFIITGASRGLGRAIALALANSKLVDEKSLVVLTSTKLSDLEATREEVLKVNEGLKGRVFLYECDLSTASEVQKHFDNIFDSSVDINKKYSKVTIILNHGTLGNLKYSADLTDDVVGVCILTFFQFLNRIN